MKRPIIICLLLSFAALSCRPDRGTVYDRAQVPGRYALVSDDPNLPPLTVRDVSAGQYVGIGYEGSEREAVISVENGDAREIVWRRRLPPGGKYHWQRLDSASAQPAIQP